MSGLHLIRVPVGRNALVQWAGERGWAPRHRQGVLFDAGRALHHLLTEVFGPRVLRPFRWLLPPRGAVGNLYAYSAQDERELKEAARIYAWPEHLPVLDPARLAGKPMPAKWRKGQALGFDLLVRPVRRMLTPALTASGVMVGERDGREVDAFWLARLRAPETEHRREDVYLDWLSERFGEAAELDREASWLKGFQRTKALRGNKATEGPHATIHGVLAVKDPRAFGMLLARGVGRHKTYGYGMLLLRPAPPRLRR